MAVVAGVRVARDEAGEAGITPYLIALPTVTITNRQNNDTQIISIPVQSDILVPKYQIRGHFERC
jgi:hypothetical protein